MMIFSLLITILLLCGVQCIKNGRQEHEMEHQFVVSIQYHSFHLCSGTIIDKYHILTVAHTVVPHPPSGLSVVPGMSMVRSPYFTASAVQNIYPHPYFKEFTPISLGQSDLYWENDIAILRLMESLSLSYSIGVVSLSTTNFEAYHCFGCTMISWNYPDETDLEYVILMWDAVVMVQNDRCKHWGMHVLANQQCFIDRLEKDFISTEDLGSPIICGGFMVGLIVKEARHGEAASPSIFLSTFNYADFISNVIDGGEKNVQPGEFPYMVAIWNEDEHVCGGVIVNSHQVITAAQCIRSTVDPSFVYPIGVFKVAAGNNVVTLFDHSVQWHRVSNVQVHPHYLPTYDDDHSSWWAEHDIALFTLSTPFSWSPTVQSLRFADADFSMKQLCQVLHWTPRRISYRREYRELTKTTAILIDDERPLVQLGVFQIAAKELYAVTNARPTDIGNPIVCGGYPIGIMVRIHRINEDPQMTQIIFLHIRPYASMGFFLTQ